MPPTKRKQPAAKVKAKEKAAPTVESDSSEEDEAINGAAKQPEAPTLSVEVRTSS